MIERIVEHWLTSSTERAFQIPFAQVLSASGHRVLHIAKHGVAEHGKDIICRDPQGTLIAYQLKSGDINKSRWYAIRGEITDLVELPVQYPTAGERGSHRAVLVTNGVLSEDVRLTIDAMNQGNLTRGLRPLEVISRDELCRQFVEAHGRFLPMGLEDLRSFLEMYNRDGRRNVDKAQLASYLCSVLDRSEACTPAEGIRRVTSAMLLTSYLLLPLTNAGNHISVCEAWTLAEAQVLHYAHFARLDTAAVQSAVRLMQQAVDQELELLKHEVLGMKAGFIEGSPMGDGGLMYSIRLTVVFGWMAAYECMQSLRSKEYTISPEVASLVDSNSDHVNVWGEYAMPFVVAVAMLRRRLGNAEAAECLLAGLLGTIATTNNGRREVGLPDPYCTPDELLSSFYSMPGATLNAADFAGSSYTARALADSLVQLNRRDLLAQIWKRVIETRSVEYYPEDVWDMLLWRSDGGRERDFGYPSPTSWAALRSDLPGESELPDALVDHDDFALRLLLTYPHRFRRDLVCKLIRAYWS